MKLFHKPFCNVSDDLDYDTSFVYKIVTENLQKQRRLSSIRLNNSLMGSAKPCVIIKQISALMQTGFSLQQVKANHHVME